VEPVDTFGYARDVGTLSRDTTPEAEAVMLESLRRMSAWRRLELLDDACVTARELALAGLRIRHPDASEPEIRRLLMDVLLGPHLAARVYGPIRP